MNRYRSYGERDDQPQVVGDGAFKGVDEYNAMENIAEGEVQQAVNMDFTSQDAVTRGGFVVWPTTYRISNPVTVADSFDQPTASFNPVIAFGNGYYICMVLDAGTYKFYKSTDLKSYTLLPTTFSEATYTINSFTYIRAQFSFPLVPNRFVWVGKNKSTSTGVSFYSSDGESWSASSLTLIGTAGPFTVGNITLVSGDSGAASSVRSGTTYNDYYQLYTSDCGVSWSALDVTSLGEIKQIRTFKGYTVASFYKYNTSSSTEYNWSSYVAYNTLLTLAISNPNFYLANWKVSNVPIQTGVSPDDPPFEFKLSVGDGDLLFCGVETADAIEYQETKIYRSYDGANWDFGTSINTFLVPRIGSYPYNLINFKGMCVIPYQISFQYIWSTIFGKYIVDRITPTTLATGPGQYAIYNSQLVNNKIIVTRSFVYPEVYKISELVDSVSVYASTIYSDPNDPGSQWVALVGSDAVTFYSAKNLIRRVEFNGQLVRAQSTIVQCNNLVYIFRGPNDTPLYWNGDWSSKFELAPTPTPASGFQIIPNSNQATYYQNRLWVKKGKDEILASDILDFNTYETITNSFNLNTGSSDYIVATFPFGDKTLLVFKNKSILALNNVEGSLADVTATEVTRQVGLVGIRAITSVGPDLAYVSYKNVNLITLTATNNSVQHKTLPLSFKIKKIMDRVNWEYAYKISLGYADNKLYVALPLDNSIFCNAVTVYNFVTGQWYGEWNFAPEMNMCIQDFQVVEYVGLQKIHAVTEDGRIFACESGGYDVHNLTRQIYSSEGFESSKGIEISTKLVTRAYDTSGLNHYQRRMFIDLGTLRPNFSIVSYTEGESESTTLISDQTYSRSESWKFNDSTYDLTNANDDYNRAYRKDYSVQAGGPNEGWGPSDTSGTQPQSGFLPEAIQEFRLPLMTTRQGRLSWLEITNTQGTINIMSAGFETRPGQRSNLVQV